MKQARLMTADFDQLRHDLEVLKAGVRARQLARRSWIERLMTDDSETRLPTQRSALLGAKTIGVDVREDGPDTTRDKG